MISTNMTPIYVFVQILMRAPSLIETSFLPQLDSLPGPKTRALNDATINRMSGAETARRALVQLARQSTLSWTVADLAPDDLPSVDTLTGSRNATLALLRDRTQAKQPHRFRRGAYNMGKETGIFRVDLFQLIDAITAPPYLITAGRALAAHELSDQYLRQAIVLVTTSRRSFISRGNKGGYALLARSRRGRQGHERTKRLRPRASPVGQHGSTGGGSRSRRDAAQALDVALSRETRFAETCRGRVPLPQRGAGPTSRLPRRSDRRRGADAHPLTDRPE